MGKEIELKLCLTDSSLWDELLKDLIVDEHIDKATLKEESYMAAYYDTAAFHLKNAGFAYRVRKEGEQITATVKRGGSSEGGLHQREEFNKAVTDLKPDLKVFFDAPFAEELLRLIQGKRLKKLFSTSFKRHSLDVVFPDGTIIELAADKGEILAGKKKEELLEIELELKQGSIITLLRFAATLAKKYPLLLENRSKYYRGLVLSDIEPDEHTYASTYQIDGHKDLEKILYLSLLGNLHRIIQAQDEFIKNPQDIETLHQIRVRIRYLRSLLSFFKPLIKAEAYYYLQSKLRKMAKDLSASREADVIVEAIEKCFKHIDLLGSEETLLKDHIISIQETEKLKAKEYIQSAALTPEIMDIWLLLLEKPFIESEIKKYTFTEYLNYRILSWNKKMRKLLKNAAIKDFLKWHEIRIQIKKLRYVFQEFAGILPKKSRQTLKKLKVYQDLLGDYVDIYRNRIFIEKNILKEKNQEINYQAGIFLGWEASCLQILQESIIQDCESIARQVFKPLKIN